MDGCPVAFLSKKVMVETLACLRPLSYNDHHMSNSIHLQ